MAAVPFAVFAAIDSLGTMIASVLAASLFTIALLAKTYQVRAVGRLLVGGLLGWCFGQLWVRPLGRPLEHVQFLILCVLVGLVGGALHALPVYCEYSTRLAKNCDETNDKHAGKDEHAGRS